MMSGSDLQGRWMPSSVTEEDVLKLRDARYLTGEISHRLPAQGQVIPTPKPGESMVFVPHFLRGLGFPTAPFMRGLMFYYGMEFHDLAPESILKMSSFIVVCEAFLHITPHFGLWLRTFKVESKMIEGQHAVCGGAIIARWPTLHGPRALSKRSSAYGNETGFTSQPPGAPHGWRHLLFTRVPHHG